MLPVLQGIIRRRVLLNFRADPSVVQRLIPPPLEVIHQNGTAIVGVCLIGLQDVRPKGFPATLGISSENLAHRVAIHFPTTAGKRDGVFIWRRDTDHILTRVLGGRVFPGVHHGAVISVEEGGSELVVKVRTKHGDADVELHASSTSEWKSTPAFADIEEACEFFRRGDCGFSCSREGNRLDGIQLKTREWSMQPIRVDKLFAGFFQNSRRFPAKSVQFDSAFIMRGLPHEWHKISIDPEISSATALPAVEASRDLNR